MSAASSQVLPNHQHDFEGVISRYSPVLFRVAFRLLRNIEDAQDAVQDALLSAHKHINQFEGRSHLSTWLTTIVTNVALMKRRRNSRQQMLSLDQVHENDGEELVPEIKDARPTPEASCAQAEIDETIRRALLRLSPKLREAIRLRDLEGRSTLEAANILRISANTLKSRVSRARATLGALIGDGVRPRLAARPAQLMDPTDGVRRQRNSLEQREGFAPATRSGPEHSGKSDRPGPDAVFVLEPLAVGSTRSVLIPGQEPAVDSPNRWKRRERKHRYSVVRPSLQTPLDSIGRGWQRCSPR